MADFEPPFETADEALKYWTHKSRADYVGQGDWIEARKQFEARKIDIFLPHGEDNFILYQLKKEFAADRENVRAFTKQARRRTFERSMA